MLLEPPSKPRRPPVLEAKSVHGGLAISTLHSRSFQLISRGRFVSIHSTHLQVTWQVSGVEKQDEPQHIKPYC